jgi:hypothetical protein
VNENSVAVERCAKPIYSARETAPGIAQKRAQKKSARMSLACPLDERGKLAAW